MLRLQIIFGHQTATWYGALYGQLAVDEVPAVISSDFLLGDGQNSWLSLQWLVQLLFLAGVVWIAYRMLRPPPAIKIRIQDGSVVVVAGKVRRQFLADLADVVTRAHIKHGTITAPSLQSGRVVFRFSSEFSPELQLQIRNIWYAGL